MVRIEDYTTVSAKSYNEKELVTLLSSTNFVSSSFSPSESTLASVFKYHEETDNFGFNKVIYLKKGVETVGVLLIIISFFKYKNKSFPCAQGTAGFISPQHRGTFGLVFEEFMSSFDDTLKLFMFSAPAVHKTAIKNGFIEVEKYTFSMNYLLLLKPFQFIGSKVRFKIGGQLISKLGKALDPIFFMVQTKKKDLGDYICEEDPLMKNDYDVFEDNYNKIYSDFIRPEWSSETLKYKYLKNAIYLSDKHQNNSSFIITAKVTNGDLCGMMVLKKVPNNNKLAIVDIQCLAESKNQVVKSLIQYILGSIKKSNIDSLIFNGIGEEYIDIINSNFMVSKRQVGLKAYMNTDIPDLRNHMSKVKLFYSTDDINF